MPPEPNPFSVVAFTARPHLRRLSPELARKLKAEHGATTIMYASTPETVDYYRKTGAFDAVVMADRVLTGDHHDARLETEVPRARRIEQAYGLTINHLALTNRHLGRGFALGGFHHPRSALSESCTYPGMLKLLSDQVEFWETEIASRRITLLIDISWLAWRVFEAHGIPTRRLAFARVNNRYMWAFDGWDGTPLLRRAWVTLEGQDVDVPSISPPAPHLGFRSKVIKKARFASLLWNLGFVVTRAAYWRWRGYQKAKGYKLADSLTGAVRQWRDVRRVTSPKMARLADLEGQDFVFYPLHTEPEKALQTLSPLNFYQLSTIAGLARDLPAGVLLVVKEHAIAAGRRPDRFYEQIAEFKNVVMLNMAELGTEIVQQARAVATITSTAGLEAALLGKPVITFGRHNIYNFLPHVRLVTDEAELKPALDWALGGGHDEERARLDGARFLEALKRISFDLPGYDETRPEQTVSAEAPEAMHNHLLETFREAPYGLKS